MKKIILFIFMIQLFLSVGASASDRAVSTESVNIGSPTFTQSQGENGWYLCSHENGMIRELVWSEENGGWFSTLDGSGAKIMKDEMLPSTTKDLDFKFTPNTGGMYNLKWDIAWKFTMDSGNASTTADGMTLSIILNGKTIWEKKAALQESVDCTLTIMLEAGDEIHFRANCNNQPWFDSFTGYPKVELVGIYYQKNDSDMVELSRDRCNKVYIADDLVARISPAMVLPTDEYSLVRRYIIPENGRYRISGQVESKDKNGNGNILRFYKNSELIREQLCLCGEKTSVDLGILCNQNDVIDIEVGVNEHEGFNYATWDINIERTSKVIRNCENTTTSGFVYNTMSSMKLSDYIAKADTYNTGIYTEVYGEKYPMSYDSSSSRWQETKLDKSGITRIPKGARETLDEYLERITIADAGYVSSKTILSARNWAPGAATVIDIPITKNGTLAVTGDFVLGYQNDGELIQLLLNGNCVWSNRIGGEDAVHFEEPYDTKYFIQNINALLNVNKGDVLSFRFSKWRNNNSSETVDISGITINYVDGSILSKQTKWKLDNSVVIDTITGEIYNDGVLLKEVAYVSSGTTYIPSNVALDVFGYENAEKGNVSFRNAAEATGNTVVWAADRFAIAHGGIPGMYTWNELSEIKTHSELKGGVLYE